MFTILRQSTNFHKCSIHEYEAFKLAKLILDLKQDSVFQDQQT